MAEAQYVPPSNDPLSGVSKGVNIFERLQRIKQVEAEGKHAAENHLLDRATSTYNLEVAQFKLKSASADWEIKQAGVAKWKAARPAATELDEIDQKYALDPVGRMKAYSAWEASRAYAVGIPEAKAEMDALLRPRREDAQLKEAELMADGTIPNFDSAEEGEGLDPAYEYELKVNRHIGRRWVKTDKPNRKAMRVARSKIAGADSLEKLNAVLADPDVMLVDGFEQTQQAVRSQAIAIEAKRKQEREDEKDAIAATQAELTAEQTRGNIEAQNLSRREKLQEAQTLAVEGDAKIRELTEALKNPKELEKLVGPIDGTGFMKAFNTMFLPEVRAGQFKLEQIINIELLGKTKFLRPISEDELMFLKTTVPSMRDPVEVWIPWLTDLKQIREDAGRAVPVQEKYRGFATTGSLSGTGAPSSGKAKVMELLDQRGKK